MGSLRNMGRCFDSRIASRSVLATFNRGETFEHLRELPFQARHTIHQRGRGMVHAGPPVVSHHRRNAGRILASRLALVMAAESSRRPGHGWRQAHLRPYFFQLLRRQQAVREHPTASRG